MSDSSLWSDIFNSNKDKHKPFHLKIKMIWIINYWYVLIACIPNKYQYVVNFLSVRFIIETGFFSLKQNPPDKKPALMFACLAEHECNHAALHLLQFAKGDSVIGSNLNAMFTNSSIEEQYFHSNKWTILERLIASTLLVYSFL